VKTSWQGKVEEAPDGSLVGLTDSKNQSLVFRVDPVFLFPDVSENNKGHKGLWIEYQEQYLVGNVKGPVLMDKKNWEKIRDHINKKFRGRSEKKSCKTKKILCSM